MIGTGSVKALIVVIVIVAIRLVVDVILLLVQWASPLKTEENL